MANKIVNDNVKFVVGHLCSSSTQPASDIYEDEGILMITAASTSPDITSRGYELIFRTIGLDSLQGPTAGNFIADHVKPKNVAVIHDKQQYGEGIATAVKQTLESKNIKVGLFEGINAGDKDSPLIAKLKREGVDCLLRRLPPELGLLLRQSKEKGLNVRFMGPEGVGNSEISAIAGPASEGMYVTLPKSFDQDPRNKELVDAFKASRIRAACSCSPPTPRFRSSQKASRRLAAPTPTRSPKRCAATPSTLPPATSRSMKGDLKDFNFVVYEWHQDGTKTEAK